MDLEDREREIVVKAIVNKLNDNISKGGNVSNKLTSTKSRLLWRLKSDDQRRKFENNLRERIQKLRKELKKDHQHLLKAIRMAVKKEEKVQLPRELRRYKSAKIFTAAASKDFKPGTIVGPVQIGLEHLRLGEDEVAALYKGPKFCVRRVLSKERYLLEAEKSFCKMRYELFDRDAEDFEECAGESKEEREERLRVEKLSEIAEVESKTVFNEEEGDHGTINYGRKRATYCKHNTNIKLTGPRDTKTEEELEYRRVC